MRWYLDTHKYMSEITRSALQTIISYGITSSSEDNEIERAEMDLADKGVYKSQEDSKGKIRRNLFTYFRAYWCLDENENPTEIGRAFAENVLSLKEFSFYFSLNYLFDDGDISYYPAHLLLKSLKMMRDKSPGQAYLTIDNFASIADCNSVDDINDDFIEKLIDRHNAKNTEQNSRGVGFDVWARLLCDAGILKKDLGKNLIIANPQITDWILQAYSQISVPEKGKFVTGIIDCIPVLSVSASSGDTSMFKEETRSLRAFLFDEIDNRIIRTYIYQNNEIGFDKMLESFGLEERNKGFYKAFRELENLIGYKLRDSQNQLVRDLGTYIISIIIENIEPGKDPENYPEQKEGTFSLLKIPESFDLSYSTRFITSLLSKPFVILTGNSGTGKTRIAKQFAEYLEVIDENKEKNWLIVPVGADWTDNTRVMGYYNPLAANGKGKYEKTGILRLIERANQHPYIPYFLILDEMNLSHVERYFSDFLSHMETPDNPFEIAGYNSAAPSEDSDEMEAATEKEENIGKIDYPANLFVVGTVNIDETTYMFSPKVLDRANVIEFKPKQENVMNLLNGSIGYFPVSPANDGSAEAFLRLAKAICAGESELDDVQTKTVRDVFDEIYEITGRYGFEFAYRTVKEIRRYISASLKLIDDPEQIDLYSVIDEQLLQKVLPKIHGNRKEIGNMLDELKALCARSGKELPLSAAKIQQMKGKLDTVQYASFI